MEKCLDHIRAVYQAELAILSEPRGCDRMCLKNALLTGRSCLGCM